MKWASSASDDAELEGAIRRAADEVRRQLGGGPPDLVIAFVSSHHAAGFTRVPALVAAELGGGVLLGCSAGGVIGGGREIEQRPGVSVTAAMLPGVDIHPFQLDTESLPSPSADASRWSALFGIAGSDAPHFVELDWRRASGPAANDGSFQMWIDGTSVSALSGLANDAAAVGFARLGVMTIKTGANGTLYFDDFVSRRRFYTGP